MQEFTEYARSYLMENYMKQAITVSAKHLKVSNSTVRRWAIQLGLAKVKQPIKIEKHMKSPVARTGNGYCRDCMHYLEGGSCGMNGRYTGALNEKRCFNKEL